MHQRRGFTMLELTVAAGLMGTVFLITIPLLSKVRDTREETQRRFIAQQEAANLMERLALRAAEGTLSDAITQEFPASEEAQAVLPQAEVTVSGGEQTNDVGHVPVTVAVSWVNNTGERTSPVSLVAWFPIREEQP